MTKYYFRLYYITNEDEIMNKMKNLFINNKNNLIFVSLVLLLLFSASCRTCKYETANLKVAQKKEKDAQDRFNINADSCLYIYGAEMPEKVKYGIYARRLPYGPTKKDSVEVLTVRINEILPLIEKTDPKYEILEAISKSGVKALLLWPEYEKALQGTKTAEESLFKCKNK